MEIALFLVLALVAYIYFSAERKSSPLHRTFSVLLITALVHLVFDALTIYTVNHLDTVPRFLNDTLHRFFIGTMILILYLFYQYIAILVEEETGKPRRRPRGEALSMRRGAWRAASARALRRHPSGELFRRHPRKRIL